MTVREQQSERLGGSHPAGDGLEPDRALTAPAGEPTEALYAALRDTLDEGVVTLDGEGRIVEANASFAGMVDRPRGSLAGEALRTLVEPDYWPVLERTLRPERTQPGRAELLLARPEEEPFRARLTARWVASGEQRRCLVVVEDVELSHVQRLLDCGAGDGAGGPDDDHDHPRAPRAAPLIEDRMGTRLAHELRNILTPLQFATRVFQAGGDAAQASRAGLIIQRQVGRMARLIDDLVRGYKAQQDSFSLRFGRVDLQELVREVVQMYSLRIESAGLDLRHHEGQESTVVRGDPVRLEQVLYNLVDNAIRHTPRGGSITVSTWRAWDECVVSVEDTGAGLSAMSLARLFSLLGRERRVSAGRSDGLGLGIPLSRQIVELHGGSMSARSKGPGQGATFTVRLPAAQ